MRTVDATLQAGLQYPGSGQFIAKVEFKAGAQTATATIVSAFELDEGNLSAWVKIPNAHMPAISLGTTADSIFRISRGLNIGGTDYYIASSWFTIYESEQDDEYIIWKGHIFKDIHYSTFGDVAANDLLTTLLANSYVSGLGYSNTITYPTDTPWWKTIQFLADSSTFELGSLHRLNGMLQQKYILNLIDLGGNVLFPIDNGQFNEHEPIDPIITPLTKLIKYSVRRTPLINKYFKWRDEAGTEHTQGSSGYPTHNMGYIESTVTPFSLNEYDSAKMTAKLAPPDLRLTSQDYIELTPISGLIARSDWFKIKEVFNPNARPAWYQELQSVQLLGNTEGGGIPAEIEQKTRYTQTNVSEFKRILTNADSNLQAALNTLDKKLLLPETNSADIFRCNSSGASTFSGTIASKAGANVVYNAGFSGNENALVAANTNQLAKLRLYNTTRGTSALISTCTTATNTITLTDTVPAGWTAGDTITIASQTVSGGGFNWVDLEITGGPLGATSMFFNITAADTTGTNIGLRLHPLATFGNGKVSKILTQVVNVSNDNLALVPITGNIFSASWEAGGAASMTIIIRMAGYIS